MIYIQAEVTKEPIAWILSIYFVVYGLLMIIFGAKLKTSHVEVNIEEIMDKSICGCGSYQFGDSDNGNCGRCAQDRLQCGSGAA